MIGFYARQLAWTAGLCWLLSPTLVAQTLRYDLKPEQKATYSFDIEIDQSHQITQLKGTVHYLVDSVHEQHVRFVSSGGLAESVKTKPRTGIGSSSPFPTFAIPPVHPLFGRSNFPGKGQSKNVIDLNPQGVVLALDGSSQLPYLLGHLSLLPFEILPTEEKKSWQSNGGTVIEGSNPTPTFLHRPFGPLGFMDGNASRNHTASESSKYEIESKIEDKVTVKKSYELKSPELPDRESFEMKGSGTWTFDTKENLPLSSDMKYMLQIKAGNTTVTYPVSVKFEKLTAERLVAIESEAKANREKAQKQLAEMKAAAEAPLEGAELDELLSNLRSKDHGKQHQALIKLSQKKLDDPHPKIVEAIHSHIKEGGFAKHLAESVLEKLDPTFKINKVYQGSSSVESTGRTIDKDTELYSGQIIQVTENKHFWYPAEFVQWLSDGRILARYKGWGQKEVQLARSQVQLAPEGVTQPKKPDNIRPDKPASSTTTGREFRTWKDNSGTFTVEAKLVSIEKITVLLKLKDGREVSVPLSRLSPEDGRYVEKTLEDEKAISNPFDPK